MAEPKVVEAETGRAAVARVINFLFPTHGNNTEARRAEAPAGSSPAPERKRTRQEADLKRLDDNETGK